MTCGFQEDSAKLLVFRIFISNTTISHCKLPGVLLSGYRSALTKVIELHYRFGKQWSCRYWWPKCPGPKILNRKIIILNCNFWNGGFQNESCKTFVAMTVSQNNSLGSLKESSLLLQAAAVEIPNNSCTDNFLPGHRKTGERVLGTGKGLS